LYALGLAAAITLGGAVTADAQATTKKKTPTRRTTTRARPAQSIPQVKDVPQPKTTDTVIVTRVDTVTLRRVDTVTTTMLRTDTVTRMVYPPLARLPGLFFGVGAGANIPMNDIRAVMKDSWALQGQAGFFPINSPLGLRADATYGKIHCRERDFGPNCKSPSIWTVGADAILRMPLDRTSKLNPVLYVFGGGGYAKFSDVDPRYTAFLRTANEPLWQNEGKWYYDVGPGVDFNVGGLHLYAEGKYYTILTERKNVHVFPVYGGIKFY